MKQNDWFFESLGDNMLDDFDKNFDKTFTRVSRAIIGIWIFGALFSVAVLITAVVLLLHFFG